LDRKTASLFWGLREQLDRRAQDAPRTTMKNRMVLP
jgi:hypothetical protein